MKKNSFHLIDKKRKKILPKKVCENYTTFSTRSIRWKRTFTSYLFFSFSSATHDDSQKKKPEGNATAGTYISLNWNSISDQQPQTTGQHEFEYYLQKFLPLKYDTLTIALDVKRWNLKNNSLRKKKWSRSTGQQKTSSLMEFQDVFIFLIRVKDLIQCTSKVVCCIVSESKMHYHSIINWSTSSWSQLKEVLNCCHSWTYATNNICL